MKKFFFSHPDIALAVIAFVLLAALIGLFSWGINDVVSEVYESKTSSAQTQNGFDLQTAQQLGLPTPSSTTSNSNGTSPTTTATTTPTSSSTFK